jgi:hypothetical protein
MVVISANANELIVVPILRDARAHATTAPNESREGRGLCSDGLAAFGGTAYGDPAAG